MPVNIDSIDDGAMNVQPGVQQTARGSVADASAEAGPIPAQSAGNHGPRGHFMPGNTASVSTRLHVAVQPLAAKVASEKFLIGALMDEGERPLTRRASLIAYRARLHGQIELLTIALEQYGQFDKRGRLRVAWLQRLESMINSCASIDRSLGVERRPRVLPHEALELWKTQAHDPAADHRESPRATDDPERRDRPDAPGD